MTINKTFNKARMTKKIGTINRNGLKQTFFHQSVLKHWGRPQGLIIHN